MKMKDIELEDLDRKALIEYIKFHERIFALLMDSYKEYIAFLQKRQGK